MRSDAALLIVGHGSTVNADSSAPTLQQASAIRARAIFREVACCFWKEEPSLRDALYFFRGDKIREVYVVPNFISEGYFTETVIPRELELHGRRTIRPNEQVWKYCPPVGSHSEMTELLLSRARAVAPDVSPRETALLVVAHGTELNDKSAVAAKREAEKIRALNRFATVGNAYMEEPPLIADWPRLTNTPNVIVVPFFISDGLHSYEDIPRLLGLAPNDAATVFQKNPHRLHGRNLYYANALGNDPRLADLIVAQAAEFDRALELGANG